MKTNKSQRSLNSRLAWRAKVYTVGGLAHNMTHINPSDESTDAAAPAPNVSWPLVMVNQTAGCLF